MADTEYIAFRGQLKHREHDEERALIRSTIRNIERTLTSSLEGRPPWLVVAYAFRGGTTYGAYHAPSSTSFVAHSPEELVEQLQEAFRSEVSAY